MRRPREGSWFTKELIAYLQSLERGVEPRKCDCTKLAPPINENQWWQCGMCEFYFFIALAANKSRLGAEEEDIHDLAQAFDPTLDPALWKRFAELAPWKMTTDWGDLATAIAARQHGFRTAWMSQANLGTADERVHHLNALAQEAYSGKMASWMRLERLVGKDAASDLVRLYAT